MKIIFNTHSPTAAASLFYRSRMKMLPGIRFDDYDHYGDYDVALFMTYKDDLPEMCRARRLNPDLRIGIMDARGAMVRSYLDVIDFFVLDSVEMSDYWGDANRPIFIYPDIPEVPLLEKRHMEKKRIVVGYHGNQAHLAGMYRSFSPALELLGHELDIELLAVYNLKAGKCEFGLPRHVKVCHVQWHENVYTEELSEADIGICPALMPLRNPDGLKRRASLSCFFQDNNDDYLIRYKMPSNDGRAAIFGFLGIPVVADMLPSFLQLIRHGYDGFIVHHPGGCYQALKHLAFDAELRERMSSRMREKIRTRFDFARINRDFLAFLAEVPAAPSPPLNFHPSPDRISVADAAVLGRINRRLYMKSIVKTIMKMTMKK